MVDQIASLHSDWWSRHDPHFWFVDQIASLHSDWWKRQEPHFWFVDQIASLHSDWCNRTSLHSDWSSRKQPHFLLAEPATTLFLIGWAGGSYLKLGLAARIVFSSQDWKKESLLLSMYSNFNQSTNQSLKIYQSLNCRANVRGSSASKNTTGRLLHTSAPITGIEMSRYLVGGYPGVDSRHSPPATANPETRHTKNDIRNY